MNWSKWLRQFHRAVAILFTLTAIVTVIAFTREEPIEWLAYVPLLPLALLFLSGLYLFTLPYATKWRERRRAALGE